MEDLREKFGATLQRMRQQSQQAGDAVLVTAVDGALLSLEKAEPLFPSPRPEVENLRNILVQQTALRSKVVIPALIQVRPQYQAGLQTSSPS